MPEWRCIYMSEEVNNTPQQEQSQPETGQKSYFNRRDVIKGLATIPVLGVFFYKLGQKYNWVQTENAKKAKLLTDIGLSGEAPAMLPSTALNASSKKLRIGFVGYGSRGEYVMRACGFAHPDWLEQMKKASQEDKNDKRYEDFMKQDSLNIEINGVCDAFEVRAQRALEAVKNGANSGQVNENAKIYRSHRQMLDSDDIDAIIVCTPEHWHAQMAIDAAERGKHIYLEKPLCLTIPQIYQVYDAVKSSGIKFQLGHQSRQTDAYMMANEVIKKGVLGKINMVSLTTNRNDPNGAWIYNIHPEATPMNINWRLFLGNSRRMPFNMERFFRWRLWYDYGTGLSGDLFTHEFDAVNMILELGIPSSAIATGGVYHYKDGREVPDVYQACYEYPEKDFTLTYSATLANNTKRGKLFMGSDGTMDLGQLHASALSVTADSGSERYKDWIEQGIINTEQPMFSYSPGSKGFDTTTSATEKYFASRGLLYTYRDGKRVDTTHLHILEWLEAIRNNGTTSCNIDRGFEEAVSAHMGTLAYKMGTRVEWDHEARRITNVTIPRDWTDEAIQDAKNGNGVEIG